MMKFLVAVPAVLIMGACSPQVPKLAPKPDTTNQLVASDGDGSGVEMFSPEVDIIFIVDDSGSMQSHQTNLARNIDKFAASFGARTNIDYQIGVLTSSMDRWGGGGSGSPCCGRLVGSPPYIDRNSQNGINNLARNLMVGTNGSATEKFFEPILAALTPPLIDRDNAGFLRPKAFLALIFITDTEEQSEIPVQEFVDQLVAIKGGRPERIIGYSVHIPDGTPNCAGEGMSPRRLEQFLNGLSNAGRNIFNLCDPAFGDRVAQIGDDLVRYVGNTILLSRPPILSTVRISYGDQEIPPHPREGWSYDPSRNAIVFGDALVWSRQPDGTKVSVSYESAVFPEAGR